MSQLSVVTMRRNGSISRWNCNLWAHFSSFEWRASEYGALVEWKMTGINPSLKRKASSSSSPPPHPPPPPSMVRQPMSFPGLVSRSSPDISNLYRSPPPPYIQQHQESLLLLLSNLSRGLPANLLPWNFIFSTFFGILKLPIQSICPAYCNFWA